MSSSKQPVPVMSMNVKRDSQERSIMWEIAKDISQLTGIQFGKKHEALIQNRLSRRLRELKMSSFVQYKVYLDKNRSTETSILISLLSTNHTFFFREFEQFVYVRDEALLTLIETLRKEGRKTLKVWSAACSYGHEVYTLAMFLDCHLKKIAPEMDFMILGSDISEFALGVAKVGIYNWDDLKKVPSFYMQDHWDKEERNTKLMARIKPHLKSKCEFELINLQTLSQKSSKTKFDMIFCRNVFIYFNEKSICDISEKMINRLEPHGYFFLGLSESIQGMPIELERVGKSIYKRKILSIKSKQSIVPLMDQPLSVSSKKTPIKVLCVDDSPTILNIMKKILAEADGFQVVGTAAHGQEASDFLKNQKVDVITLDIHMPIQNGIEFLEANKNAQLPPVIIVSSVSRDDASLAIKTIELGAADYVEKPSIQNVLLKGDEIRAKIHAALMANNNKIKLTHEFDYNHRNRIRITAPDKKIRLIVANLGDLKKICWIINQFQSTQPPTLILIDGLLHLDQEYLNSLKKSAQMPLEIFSKSDSIRESVFYLGTLNEESILEVKKRNFEMVCTLLLGSHSLKSQQLIFSIEKNQVFCEEINDNSIGIMGIYKEKIKDIAPYTSLAYESEKYFEGIADSAEKEKEAYENISSFLTKKNHLVINKEEPRENLPIKFFSIKADELLVCFYEPLSKYTFPFVINIHPFQEMKSKFDKYFNDYINSPVLRSKQFEVKIIRGKNANTGQIDLFLKGKAKIKGQFQGTSDCVDTYVYLDSGRIRVSNINIYKPAYLQPKSLSAELVDVRPLEKPAIKLNQKVKVLIVDDSEPIRILLRKILGEDKMIEVIGEAKRPSEVEALIVSKKPDVITLDIHMPEMTGTQLLEIIYPKYKIPTIIVTSMSPNEGNDVLKALEIGAFDYIQKPSFDKIAEMSNQIREKVFLASRQVKEKGKFKGIKEKCLFDPRRPICIGSSTGGVEAIKNLFELFPNEIPPTLIVQHIPAFFSKAFADRLNQQFPFEVREAKTGDVLLRNLVLIATGGKQMQIRSRNGLFEVFIEDGPSHLIHKPSVDVLFKSVADSIGKRAIGIILTGMGSDGAQGLKKMRDMGCYTLGQSEESCVVYGMPKAAKAMGGVTKEIPLERIPFEIATAPHYEKKEDSEKEIKVA